jgi:hypothetical protein
VLQEEEVPIFPGALSRCTWGTVSTGLNASCRGTDVEVIIKGVKYLKARRNSLNYSDASNLAGVSSCIQYNERSKGSCLILCTRKC